jgi:cytochrome c oxidase cbb3-type subunit 2
MLNPPKIVPGSIMPAYDHQFENEADIETAFAEAVTVKNVFHTPYGPEIKSGKEAWEAYKPTLLAEAKEIAANMKDERVKAAIAEGKVPEVVALIAYLNSLK